MCVIAVSQEQRISKAAIESCYRRNGDGGGVAWREGQAVHWKKGLELEEMIHLAQELPLPFVMHFRIASCGGKLAKLTHPFPITKGVDLSMEGHAKEVLFHNGHWGSYEDKAIEFMVNSQLAMPDGPWSDSRVAAWISSRLGTGWLEMLSSSRWVVFGVDKLIKFGPVSFAGWNDSDGVWYSNSSWRSFQSSNVVHYPKHHSTPGRQITGTVITDGEDTEEDLSNATFRGGPAEGSVDGGSDILLQTGNPASSSRDDLQKADETSPSAAEQGMIRDRLTAMGLDEDEIEWAMAFNYKQYRGKTVPTC